MLLSEAFEVYRTDYIVFKNQSPKTEETHLLAARSIISFTGDLLIESLTFQHVRDWKSYLDSSKSSNTSRLYIIKLRNVLKFMRIRGVQCLMAEEVAVAKRQETPIDFFSPEDVCRLLDAIKVGQTDYTNINVLRNRAIISLLYASGIRVSELCRMNRSDVRPDKTFTVFGKGGKHRLCFIDERAHELVGAYLASRMDTNPSLFICEQTGLRITPGMVQLMFRIASRRAGFDRTIHPHVMRHSFATNMLRNNTNLFYVSKFLGHSSTQTTERYTHFVDEDLRAIYGDKHTF